jgi:hypothetical protein
VSYVLVDWDKYHSGGKREAAPLPAPKRPIDGDYLKPNDASYPVRARAMLLDAGIYDPENKGEVGDVTEGGDGAKACLGDVLSTYCFPLS